MPFLYQLNAARRHQKSETNNLYYIGYLIRNGIVTRNSATTPPIEGTSKLGLTLLVQVLVLLNILLTVLPVNKSAAPWLKSTAPALMPCSLVSNHLSSLLGLLSLLQGWLPLSSVVPLLIRIKTKNKELNQCFYKHRIELINSRIKYETRNATLPIESNKCKQD